MRALAILTAAPGLTLFAWNLLAYLQRPPAPHSLRCGNCILGSLGVSAELALLSLLIARMILTRTRPRASHIPDWLYAALGILLTPYVMGIPIFAMALFELASTRLTSPPS